MMASSRKRGRVLRWVVYVLAAPQWLLSWFVVCFALMIRRAVAPFLTSDGILWAVRRHDARYSTTMAGPGVLLSSAYIADTMAHERVHVRQFQDLSVGSLLSAIFFWATGAPWPAALAYWIAAPTLLFLLSYPLGWLRGGDAYMGSELEKSAYAQTRARKSIG